MSNFDLTGDEYSNPADEGRIITAEFDDFWVVNCYTPNSKGDLSRLDLRYKKWDKAVLTYLEELELSKPVLYCGDMNVAHQEIDLANPKPNVGKHGLLMKKGKVFRTIWTLVLLTLSEQLSLKKLVRIAGGHTGQMPEREMLVGGLTIGWRRVKLQIALLIRKFIQNKWAAIIAR